MIEIACGARGQNTPETQKYNLLRPHDTHRAIFICPLPQRDSSSDQVSRCDGIRSFQLMPLKSIDLGTYLHLRQSMPPSFTRPSLGEERWTRRRIHQVVRSESDGSPQEYHDVTVHIPCSWRHDEVLKQDGTFHHCTLLEHKYRIATGGVGNDIQPPQSPAVDLQTVAS